VRVFEETGASGEAGGEARWQLVACVDAAHAQDVNCVRWHPSDPALLLSCSDDESVKLWRFTPESAADV